MRWICLAAGIATLLAACAHAPAAPDADALRKSLLQADLDFAQDVALRGTEAWVAVFAPDGAMFVDGDGVVRGHERIRAAMAALGDPRRAPGKVQLRWTPLGAEVSRDGTLGWTYGNAIVISATSQEKLKYVTVWRREGHAWKVVADLGNSGLADPGVQP
jgi:ketosteroid isomerase-like protein